MGYITDIYAGFSFASTCPFPDGTFADGLNHCDWSHQFSYSTDPAQIPADQTNYRVVITEACFSAAELTEFMTNVQSGGEDIRVTLSDGSTEIPFAVVAIDTVAETIELHARIAGTTSSTVATTLKIYTGNAAASAYALNATYGQYNCFQDLDYYLAMQQDPSGGVLTDLAGNLGNWAVQNMEAGDKVTQTNGMAAYTYDGVDERTIKTSPGILDQNGALTALVKINSVFGAASALPIVSFGGGNSANDGVMVMTKRRNASLGDGTSTYFDMITIREATGLTHSGGGVTTALAAGTTYLVSWVGNVSANSGKIYVDGVDQTMDNWGPFASWAAEGGWFLACNPAATQQLSLGASYRGGAYTGFGNDTIGPVFQESTVPGPNLQATRSNNYKTPGTFGQITGWIQS